MGRRVTSPTWGPPPPCKQASLHESTEWYEEWYEELLEVFLIARVFSMGVTCIYFTNNRQFAR